MIEQNRLKQLNIILFFLSLVMLVVHIEGMGTQFDPSMHVVFLSCRSRLERYYSAAQ